MLETLTCPNCQAALTYDAAERPPTLHCDYCGSTIIVPASLGRQAASGAGQTEMMAQVMQLVRAGRSIEAIKLVRESTGLGLKESKELVDAVAQQGGVWLGGSNLTITVGGVPQATVIGDSGGAAARRVGCIVGAIVLLTLLGIGASLALSGLFITRGVSETVEQVATLAVNVPEIAIPTIPAVLTAQAETAPVTATLLRQFGGQEGIGPGFFNDTRDIAVAADGTIFTADYLGGRIQAFDPDGRFLLQWQVDPEMPILGMTADRDGRVYVIQGGDIQRYDGATGQLLDPLYSGNVSYRALTTAPDGSLVAIANDRLTRWDAQGALQLDLPDPFAAVAGFRTTHEGVAVDGAGLFYVLGSEAVYVFDADGRFVNRVGSEGDAPDQFRTSPSAIAVDGQGRVYAVDFEGIKVFDANGRFLELLPLAGVAFDMLVTPQNELIVMDRNANAVLIYQINPLMTGNQ